MDKVVVITGGTGGLGSALISRLIRQDYRLAVSYLLPEEAERFESQFEVDDERLTIRRVDATNPEAVNGFMKDIAEQFGALHVVCALVGGWAGGRDVEDTDDLRFERMIDLNLRSAFYTARAALPYIRTAGWGRVILVGSRAAFDTPGGQAAFNAAKAGVVALGKTIAAEIDGTGVTCNVLLPSVIDTPATRSTAPYADYIKWPTPDEIAAVAEFLISEQSGVISGAALPVFGRT
ncbi:MAG: SDR family oxidoreductase [Acidimicrobiia bacterium]|nr:SDR family oxidoreductase [Acidimicrobiia bacterium]